MFIGQSRLDFMHPMLGKIKTKELVRNFAKFVLLCPGSLVYRLENKKFCFICDADITGTNVFIHRIRECVKRQYKRKKAANEHWFVHQQVLPVHQALLFLINQTSVEFLKLFY